MSAGGRQTHGDERQVGVNHQTDAECFIASRRDAVLAASAGAVPRPTTLRADVNLRGATQQVPAVSVLRGPSQGLF